MKFTHIFLIIQYTPDYPYNEPVYNEFHSYNESELTIPFPIANSSYYLSFALRAQMCL